MRLHRLLATEEVWGYTFYGDARTVDVHVRQVRKKLGPWAGCGSDRVGPGLQADPDARPAPRAPTGTSGDGPLGHGGPAPGPTPEGRLHRAGA